MTGHGEKLTRKQEAAIAALLTHGTVRDAAKACELGEATLWRWMQLPEFQARYRAARRQVVSAALTVLQSAARNAVGTLMRNLKCGTPSVEVSAARVILETSIRASETQDLQERIERLEELSNESRKQSQSFGKGNRR